MAATARLTALRNSSSGGMPRSSPSPNTTATIARHAQRRRRPTWSSFRWSGVSPGAALSSSVAMRPTSVAMPVATTTARPAPLATLVPRKTMFRRSASGVSAAQRPRVLVDRLGLAGERRLARAQRRRVEEARVGGDEVAALEQEDVATHHLGRGHHDGVAVAHDARPRRRQAGERRDRALGAVLLEEADQGVQDDDGEDGDAVDPLADGDRHGRRADQHPDDDAAELTDQDVERPDLRVPRGSRSGRRRRAVGAPRPRRAPRSGRSQARRAPRRSIGHARRRSCACG